MDDIKLTPIDHSITNPLVYRSPSNESLPSVSKQSSDLILEHLPFNHPTDIPKSLHPQTITLITDELLEELNQISLTPEEEIEQKIAELLTNTNLIEASLNVEGSAQQYPKVSLAVIKAGAEFLETVLPTSVLELSGLEQSLEIVSKLAGLGKIFISATNNGTLLMAVVCKEAMLNESEMILEKVQDNLKNSKNLHLGPTQHLNIEKQLKEWKVNLAIERKKLSKEKVELGISTSFTVSSLVLFIVNLAAKGSGLLSTLTSIAGETVATTAHGIEFGKEALNSNHFTHWHQDYQKWQKMHIPQINKESGSIDDLLRKREAAFQKKVEQVELNYAIMEPKIRESALQQYKQSIHQFSKQLESPNMLLETIEDSYVNLGIDIQALNHSFQKIKSLISSGAPAEKIKDAKNNFLKTFNDWKGLEENISVQFQNWFKSQPRDNLVKKYVDNQASIEQTTKNALKEVIQHKHALERKFFDFNFVTSGIVFHTSLIVLALTVAFAIITALTVPLAGFGIAILIISCAPITLSLGFYIGSIILALKEKPQSTKANLKGLSSKIIWNRIKLAIGNYQHVKKVARLRSTARLLRQLHLSDKRSEDALYQKTFYQYLNEKNEFKTSEAKVARWNETLSTYQKIQGEKMWQDFSAYADLTVSKTAVDFDSLEAFNTALQACDLTLISSETRYLLETQLGMNLKALQDQIQHNPEAFKTAFKKYANLSESSFINFIQKQQTIIENK